MKKILLSVIMFSVFGLITKAQTPPKTADEILNNAVAQAKQQHKKVLLMFHASWCSWCNAMDKSLNDPTCKNYFDKSFVIDHIDAFEYGNKVSLDNPGGQEMYEKYGGAQGIPFWIIFDEDGNMLANSNYKIPGDTTANAASNIGCPSKEEEVVYFISLLKKYTNISDAETKAIHDRFRKNDPNYKAAAKL